MAELFIGGIYGVELTIVALVEITLTIGESQLGVKETELCHHILVIHCLTKVSTGVLQEYN